MNKIIIGLTLCFMPLALVACEGPQGDQGPAGADGADGADGAYGADGADGNDGSDGNDGANGNDGASGSDAGDFAFAEDDYADYTRVDRIGMPAIATAVITSKDSYNAADPVDDSAGDFVSEIVASVDGLHSALDDDLASVGFDACATDDCVAVAATLVVPDTIKIDITSDAGFPNGRLLEDPVIDVTLAVVLLDLSGDGECGGVPCSATSLAELPLNPAANDEDFLYAFPYVAAPHE